MPGDEKLEFPVPLMKADLEKITFSVDLDTIEEVDEMDVNEDSSKRIKV